MITLDNLKCFLITQEQQGLSVVKAAVDYRSNYLDEKISLAIDGFFQVKSLVASLPTQVQKLYQMKKEEVKNPLKSSRKTLSIINTILDPINTFIAPKFFSQRLRDRLMGATKVTRLVGLSFHLQHLLAKKKRSAKFPLDILNITRILLENSIQGRVALAYDVANIVGEYLVFAANKRSA